MVSRLEKKKRKRNQKQKKRSFYDTIRTVLLATTALPEFGRVGFSSFLLLDSSWSFCRQEMERKWVTYSGLEFPICLFPSSSSQVCTVLNCGLFAILHSSWENRTEWGGRSCFFCLKREREEEEEKDERLNGATSSLCDGGTFCGVFPR